VLEGIPAPYYYSGGEVLISSSVPAFYAVPPFSYLTGVCIGTPIFGLTANEGFVPIFGLFMGLVNGFIKFVIS